ncbi:MAG: GNAT family N-acetyltransferase [Ruminococcaceae bacterium]|nr:GNAT family N-acetyltransferase [Oscillospiraceae bacterium]
MDVIRTERLTLRRVMVTDHDSIREIWQDFNCSEYVMYDTPHDTDADAVRRRIERWASMSESMEHIFFAVCLGDALIGYVAFNVRESGYEIGYCFHSAYHKKGYAKESVSALIKHFARMGVTHFSAGTALSNTPSANLLRSLGFKLTDTEKISFYKDADGQDIVFDGGVFELEI